ncbi:MAG: hypothetical protein GY757_58395 [bacterium]|nr:hypothetical protein [bacterium]
MKQVIRKKTSPNKVRLKQKEVANKQQLKGHTIPDTEVPNNENIPYGAGHTIQTKRLCPCDGSCPTCSVQRKTEGTKGGNGNKRLVGEGTPGAGLKAAVDNVKNSGSGTPMEKNEGDYFRKQLGLFVHL